MREIGAATGIQQLFPRIAIAAIDGTARSVRHRQQQFVGLFNGLLRLKFDLTEAIKHDFAFTDTEALLEYSLTLKELRTQYESLSIDAENAGKRQFEEGKDKKDHAVPFASAVYISPQSGLYSNLAPLAAAVAAGSCVVLELPHTTSRLNSTIRKLLTDALNKDTFAICTARPVADVLAEFQMVRQIEDKSMPETTGSISSPASTKCIAFVDRDADIRLAARSIFEARFGFGGRSAYAPDFVFVHEAVAKLFRDHVSHLWAHFQSTRRGKSTIASGNSDATAQRPLKGFNTLHAGSSGVILEVKDRCVLPETSDRLLTLRRLDDAPQFQLSSPTLILCNISSSDDGLNQWNLISNNGAAAAALVFATPVEAAYISNSMNAYLTFNNHIPFELMIGPRVPDGGSGELVPRYSPRMFQQVRPQIAEHSDISQALGNDVLSSAKLETWARSMQVPLRATGEKAGKRIDFFDQALMTAAVVSISMIAITGTIGSILLQRWRSGGFSVLRR